jgi:DNA-damage-inducible protein D
MSRKKQPSEYEQPLSLDMDPDEAVARFAQADPKEADAVAALVKDDATIDGLMKAFEDAVWATEDGDAFWWARDLMRLFEYTEWRNFRAVVVKAWTACKAAGHDPAQHFALPDLSAPWDPDGVFVEVNKNPQGGRPSEDVLVTRYGAYLIAENADSSKQPVAFAQTYFTIQTRRQELADEKARAIAYDETRVMLRKRLKEHNKLLASAAKNVGVTNFGFFNGAGLKALYGGLTKAKLVAKKGLPKGSDHLDYAGHSELAANYFKATQTQERLEREGAKGQADAQRIHAEVGAAVRKTIKDQGNTLPENMPAEDHIREAQKRVNAAEPKAIAPPKAKKKG